MIRTARMLPAAERMQAEEETVRIVTKSTIGLMRMTVSRPDAAARIRISRLSRQSL